MQFWIGVWICFDDFVYRIKKYEENVFEKVVMFDLSFKQYVECGLFGEVLFMFY